MRGGSSKPHGARKRFGQHFLTDAGLVDRIIQAINPQTGDEIVEIGPGRGALSMPLLASGAILHMIEIDRDLASGLQKHIAGYENARLHVADALKMDFAALCGGHRTNGRANPF